MTKSYLHQKNPVKTFLFIASFSAHAILALWLINQKSPPVIKKPLLVKTIELKPTAPSIKETKAPAFRSNKAPKASPSTPSPAPKKKEIQAPIKKTKPVAKKTETQKTLPTPSKPKPKSPSTEKQWKELEERIAKIEAKRATMTNKSDWKAPQKVEVSSPTASLEKEGKQESYADFLISYLQHHLQLPDIGEVKIQVYVDRNGNLEKMTVIQAESEKNKRYLQAQLPKMTFPPLEGETLSSQSFILTFCHE